MKRLEQHRNVLSLLFSEKKKQNKIAILKHCNIGAIKAISEIILNLSIGNLKIPESNLKQLKRLKKTLRTINTNSLNKKHLTNKKLYIKKPGIVSLILKIFAASSLKEK